MADGEDEPIDVAATLVDVQDDEEYQNVLTTLATLAPPNPNRELDFTRIYGNCAARTAKAIVLHLAGHGWSVAEIADIIGAPANVTERYLRNALDDENPIDDATIDVLRRLELEKIRLLEKWLHEQKARSCENAVTEVTTWEIGEDGEEHQLVKRTEKGQAGNPSYVKALNELGKRRDRLLALETPTKVQIDKTERKLVVSEIIVRSRDDIAAAKEKALLQHEEATDGKEVGAA
jgi:hypothetical protein